MSYQTRSSTPREKSAAWCACFFAMLASAAFARSADPAAYAPFPAPDSGYVTDIADVLTRAQQEEIERWLWQVEARTGVEIAVVTIKSLADYPGTPNQSIEAFATAMFNRWSIGNRPKNDGVLLLVSIGDRKARIELGAGYGRSSDNAARAIMDDVIVPQFRKGDYPAGIRSGVRALMLEYAHVRVGWNWPLIIALAGIPILGLLAYSLFRNGNRGWGWVCLGLLIVLVLTVFYLLRQATRFLPDSDSSSWDAGGFGGGFGGGCSGGGGATGSW